MGAPRPEGNGRLSRSGLSFLRRQAVTAVARRLRVFDWIDRHPEILQVEIPQILLIAGFPRTGTTILHNLLSLNPAGRAMLRWELMQPTPPPETSTYERDPRIKRMRAAAERLRTGRFAGSRIPELHWIDASEPEECAWGYLDCTNFLGHGIRGMMPTWARFLLKEDMRPQFRNYRKLLQLLLWRNPVRPRDVRAEAAWPAGAPRRGGWRRGRPPPCPPHIILKAPQASTCIGAFRDIFPSCKVVLTARDPFRSLLSTHVTMEEVSRFVAGDAGVRHDDWFEVMRLCFAEQSSMLRRFRPKLRGVGAGVGAAAHAVAVCRHDDLVTDPTRAVASVYAQLGMPVPRSMPADVAAFYAWQLRGTDGGVSLERQSHAVVAADAKRYPPPERYGFDAESVWRIPLVQRYAELFQVDRERDRRPGVLARAAARAAEAAGLPSTSRL
jgi:hypothetical protein